MLQTEHHREFEHLNGIREEMIHLGRTVVVTDVTGLDKVTGQDFFFVSAVLLSAIILLCLLSSAVSLSYLKLAVPMGIKCLGKHSCMCSPFSISILNGTCSIRLPILFCGDVPAIKQLNYKLQKRINVNHLQIKIISFYLFSRIILIITWSHQHTLMLKTLLILYANKWWIAANLVQP